MNKEWYSRDIAITDTKLKTTKTNYEKTKELIERFREYTIKNIEEKRMFERAVRKKSS
jgi:hypothetical protein